MKRRFNNRWEMYEMIGKQNKPTNRIGFKMLRFLMGWSERKTKRHLNKLIKDNMVKVMDGCELCGNKEKIYYPTPVKELINWEEFKKDVCK